MGRTVELPQMLQRLALTHILHLGKLQTEVANSGWVDRIDDPTTTFQLPQACWHCS